MNNTILSDFVKQPGLVVFGVLVLVGVVASSLYGGYVLGQRDFLKGAQGIPSDVRTMLAFERRQIADAKAEQRAHLDTLALKIAELQAYVMRLDALGDRLVDVGKLDRDEFDFASAPPQGGIEETLPEGSQSGADLHRDMERLSAVLSDREAKLEALEYQLMNRDLMAEVLPSGRPLEKGWMSSSYGKRTDPFSGRKSMHRGVDFAGKPGSSVIAVASGVVIRSEKAPGYGNVVEIRHANGYSTLYAHNKKNRVKVGQMISKGDTVALLGSSGRSSGPHVHFEVHRNGKTVNPARFLSSN